MGLLDDAASLVSGRTSHHGAHSKHHHFSRSKSGHRHHHKSSRSRSRSRSRPRSAVASILGVGSEAHTHHSDHHHHKPSRRSESFFGLGARDAHHRESKYHDDRRGAASSFFGLGNNASRGSFFGFGSGRSPSYYKRSPRGSFLARAYKQLKWLIRDLLYYAKRHPAKVFMLVVVPLVTTGTLTALLARFGLRLPAGLERMLGIAAKVGAGDGIGLVGEAVRMASAGHGHSQVSVERGRDGGMQWERRSVERDDYSGWGQGDGHHHDDNDGWGDALMKGVAKMFM